MEILVLKQEFAKEDIKLEHHDPAKFESWLIADQEDLKERLNSENVKSLIDVKGRSLASFKSLAAGGRYRLGAEKVSQQATNEAIQQALSKYLPLAVKKAVKPLAREVALRKRATLDYWTPSNATPRKRSQDENLRWKMSLVDFYKDDRITGIQCMVTGHKVHDQVKAAHIWKYASGGKGLDQFGLTAKDVNNPRNGLLLVTGLEYAFDIKQMCFLYDSFAQKFFVYIADPLLRPQKLALVIKDDVVVVADPEMTYEDLHMKFHLYMPANKPFRRLLYFHAKRTFDEAASRKWPLDIPKQQWKVYRDLSPGWTDNDDDYENDDEDDGAASISEG